MRQHILVTVCLVVICCVWSVSCVRVHERQSSSEVIVNQRSVVGDDDEMLRIPICRRKIQVADPNDARSNLILCAFKEEENGCVIKVYRANKEQLIVITFTNNMEFIGRTTERLFENRTIGKLIDKWELDGMCGIAERVYKDWHR